MEGMVQEILTVSRMKLSKVGLRKEKVAWFLKCKEAGEKAGIAPPEQETISFTNFIRG